MTQQVLKCLQDFGYNSVILMNKFRHNFKDCVSPMCDCGAETETTSHFFLRCQFFANERQKLRDDVYRLDASIKHGNEGSLIDVLLYGSDRFNDSKKETNTSSYNLLYSSYQTF